MKKNREPLHSFNLSLNANKSWLQKIKIKNKPLTFLVRSSDGSSLIWISRSHELLCFVNHWWSSKAVNDGRVCCVVVVCRAPTVKRSGVEAAVFFLVSIHGYSPPFILTLLGFWVGYGDQKGHPTWKCLRCSSLYTLFWCLIWKR